MKKILITATIFFCKSLFAYPKLYFTDAQPYDQVCMAGFDYAKLSADKKSPDNYDNLTKEAKSKITDFQNQWDSVAPKLFAIMNREFKKDFKRTEYSAALSICPDSPSMPKPFVLNISRYLKSYMSPKNAKDINQFTDVVFHELLHLWLFENFNHETTIKKKYKNNGESVVNHIHLFAIESFVLEKADLLPIWNNTRDFIKTKGGPHLKALNILEKEGRDKVLQELKQ